MAVETLKKLRRRIRSIRNTMQITRAMEMVSAAKLRRVQNSLLSAKPYFSKIKEFLINLAHSDKALQHKCFQIRSEGPILLVLITADRGLCGSFNTNLIHTAKEFIKSKSPTPIQIFCIGRKGFDYFKKQDIEIVGSVTNLGGKLDLMRIQEAGKLIFENFFIANVREIYLIFTHYVSAMGNKPIIELFLPLDPNIFKIDEREKKQRVDYILEPTSEIVFESLIPKYLQSKIYITLAESFTSEYSARMITMRNATKNCEELVDTLTLKMNKARQSTITRELIDIVGGAESLR